MNQPEPSQPINYYDVRQSAVILATKIIGIEVLISLLHFIFSRVLTGFGLKEMIIFSSFSLYSLIIFLLQTVNLIIIVCILLRWVTKHYVIKPEEIQVLEGVFQRTTTVYDLQAIQSVTARQSLWGRIFHYGTVELYNPILDAKIFLQNIPDPHRYAEMIEQHRNKIESLNLFSRDSKESQE